MPYSDAVSEERAPEFEDHWRAFDAVVAYTHELVGGAATYDLGYVANGAIGVLDVTPTNVRARPISLIAEQYFTVTVGDNGGRWELSYSDDDIDLVRGIIDATVAGRVEERSALGRSRVTVTLGDGRTRHETGYFGCATLLVPQLGWTRWGKLTSYEPYNPDH